MILSVCIGAAGLLLAGWLFVGSLHWAGSLAHSVAQWAARRRPRHKGSAPLPPPLRPPWPAFMADPVPDHDPSELPPTWCDPGYVSPAALTRYDLILPRSWRDGP